MSTTQIQRSLEAITQRAALDRSQGYPLYAYRTTAEELASLRAGLQAVLEFQSYLRGPSECAAFCLFAAEWFRRRHMDGPWKWSTTLEDGLGLTGYTKEEMERQVREITLKGLRWWNLSVIRTETQRLFLTTLACQGGLPLQTLQRHGAPLRRFFRAVLRQHERYPHERIDEAVENNSYLLPPTLDNDEVRELTCGIISAVADLRHQSRDARQDGVDQLQYLEQHVPEWRDRIPLRLDDDVATQLIHGLLNERVETILASDIAVSTSLVGLENGSVRISRELSFDRQISPPALATRLGVSEQQLPPRMTLYLVSRRSRVAAANVARSFDGETFRLQEIPGAKLAGLESAGAIRLAAVTGTNEIACNDVPGGSALYGLPGLYCAEHPHYLLGLGTLTTRREEVLVTVPEQATWEAMPSGEVTRVGQNPDGFIVLRLSGEIHVHSDDEGIFRIRTRAVDEHTRIFSLFGRRRTLGPGGSEVWLGTPHVEERDTDGETRPRTVDQREIWWRSKRGGQWQPLSDGCLGDVTIRVVRDDAVLFQSDLTVFPVDFKIVVKPSRHSAGTLVFRNLGTATIQPACKEGVKTEVRAKEDEIHVDVTITSDRPSCMLFRISFGQGRAAEIEAVCPSPWIGIVDAADRPVSVDLPIPLERLDGLRLQLVTAEDRRTVLTERHHQRYLGTLRGMRAEGTFELPLSLIESQISGMLAQSDDPDGMLHLDVVQPPKVKPLFRFVVSRYPGKLERVFVERDEDSEQSTFEIFVDGDTLSSLGVSADDVKLDLAPLGHPEEPIPSDVIRPAGDARWLVNSETCRPGPYLATAWISERTCLRPLRLSVHMNDVEQRDISEVSPENQFDTALVLLDREDRRVAWDAFVRNLAQSTDHSGWTNVENLLKACRKLPVTTFETIAALTRNDEAMARIGFLKPDQDWLWQRMEQLPFLWALMSIRGWIQATTRYLTYIQEAMQSLGVSDDEITHSVQQLLQKYVNLAPMRWRGAACVAACLYVSGIDIPGAAGLLGCLMPAAKEELLARRDQERSRLVADHDKSDTRETWPNPRLPISNDVREIMNDLVIRDGHANQWAMLNAPTLAAAHAVYAIPYPPELIPMLHEIRGVDPEWFENANEIAMFLLAGRRLMSDRDCFTHDL